MRTCVYDAPTSCTLKYLSPIIIIDSLSPCRVTTLLMCIVRVAAIHTVNNLLLQLSEEAALEMYTVNATNGSTNTTEGHFPLVYGSDTARTVNCTLVISRCPLQLTVE